MPEPWLQRARHSRLPTFVRLARTITTYRPSILAAIRYRPTNVRVEICSTMIQPIIHRAFGSHCPGVLIALAKVSLGALYPPLPGRS